MNVMTERMLTGVLRSTVGEAHRTMLNLGLPGQLPLLNLHNDVKLPACVYQPRTESVAICMSHMAKITVPEVVSVVLDAMAMCACQRLYQRELREWNDTQNKGRVREPALNMTGSARWREFREQLS